MNKPVIVHTPEPAAGAAQYVTELVKGLAANGVAVTLFCPANFAHLKELPNNVKVEFAGLRGTEHTSFASRVARNLGFVVRAFLRQGQITPKHAIVHFQFPLYFPFGLLFFLLAKLQRCKIVFTAHDPIPHKWLFPSFLRFIERQPLRSAYSLSDRIIVHNESGRKFLINQFRQEPAKISVISHGPFVLGGAPIPFQFAEVLEILLFGSIRENKGIHLAVEAVQKINADGVHVRLTIAGAVANAREHAYWEHCLSQISLSPSGIQLMERYLDEDEIRVLVGNCHAMLLPYQGYFSESGVAAIALANCRPIIASNVGGFSTLLGAADLGIPIRSVTPAGVEAALRSALEIGQDELRKKGLTGAQYVHSTRSWLSIGKETADIYHSLRAVSASDLKDGSTEADRAMYAK